MLYSKSCITQFVKIEEKGDPMGKLKIYWNIIPLNLKKVKLRIIETAFRNSFYSNVVFFLY